MWTTIKKNRVLNIFSSYFNKNDSDFTFLKQTPNDNNFQKHIKLNLKNQFNVEQSNEVLISNVSQREILSMFNLADNKLTRNSSNPLFLSYVNEKERKFDEENSDDSRFSKYLGLLGSAIFGYLAMKSKNSRSESVKVKNATEYGSSEEISNRKFEEILIRNLLKNRVSTISYASNNPIEDRYNAIQLKNLDGFLVEVLDGHGGYHVAEYASKKLHIYFDEKIKELNDNSRDLNDDDKIINALNHAFTSVENDLYNHAKNSYANGVPEFIFIGSCVLVIIVHNNKIYVANCGDSKAKLYNYDGYSYNPIKISRTLNAGAKKEQTRLRSEYLDEDIFICKRSFSKACYVKGRLQPTRSLGDFYLKHEEFNLPEIRRSMKNFIKGPYIKYLPEIKVFELSKNDRYIVLATDGLWDELSPQDVAKVINQNDDNKDKIIDSLFRNALTHAAMDANMSLEQILKVEPGRKKRSLHDDITVMIVDLKNQYN